MKSWLFLAGAAFILLAPRQVEASGYCLAARFHGWPDAGCNQNNCGAGGVPPAHCPDCDNGMPRWWVHEPYENLFMSDTPLSYTTSSGQPMNFTFYYRQRYELPLPDEVPDFYMAGLVYTPHSVGDYYMSLARTAGMTNAAWGNNWMKDIVFWDSQWENKVAIGASAGQVFSKGYEAFVFCPEGNIQYFYSTNNNSQTSLKDPQSQVQLQPLSAFGYPTVNKPVADTNGICWGDTQTNGFQMLYPDGSKDVFGLCYYPAGLESNYVGHATYSGAHAFLTQRLDPQGRVTKLGYVYFISTNASSTISFGYRLRYVVDPDGRTNQFIYSTNYEAYYNYTPVNPWALQEVDDPYGRKVQFGYDFVSGVLTSIIDAAGNTNSFQYQSPTRTNTYYIPGSCGGGYCPTNIIGLNSTNNSGWITNLTTPYGNTSFKYYELPDLGAPAPEFFIQRAVYVTEPTGAQQLYYYLHNNTALAPTATSPTVPGQAFDDGTTGGLSGHNALTYRNTFHWGRRQFANLSTSAALAFSYFNQGFMTFSNALLNLNANDFNKADIKHWLLSSSDTVSITEGLSSEQDPSPDAAGTISGLRTWYNYPGKPSGGNEELGSSPQVSCIARSLPGGTNQYTIYNYYPFPPNGSYVGIYPYSGLVSDNESTYSKPDGSIGILTNWFNYATNNVDLIGVNNSAGQSWNYGYSTNHEITSATNALQQVTTLSWDNTLGTYNLLGVQFPSGKSIGLTYYTPFHPPRFPMTNTSGLLKQVTIEPEGRVFNLNNYNAGLPISITDDRNLTWNNTWDGLNRLTSTAFPDNTTISNIYYRLDRVATKDRLTNWTYYGFDGLQHLTAVTNANNAVTSYSWCGCGSLETIVDALTNLTQLNYDNQGNLTNVVFPDFSSITWQFDLARRMTHASDGAGRYVGLTYNNQGLPTSIANANGTLRQTIFDSLNRPISITDANGVTVTNQFDAINELLKRTWPDGIGESYGYSTNGLVAYTNRDQKVTLYGRDGAGRLTSVTNANTEVTQFSYDSLNNVISLIDGLQHQTTWQYNEYGWLTNKIDGLTRNAFRYAYNANGWLTNRWTPEKGNTGYTFDNVGNLKAINYSLSTINYFYNALNQLTNMVDAVGTTAFSYTPAGRLQSENGPWANDMLTYTYVQGLRTALTLSQTTSNWSQTYGFDSGWRMTGITSPAGNFGYSYNFQPASSLVTGISLPNGAKIVNSYDSLARLTGTALNNYWGHTLDGYTYTPDALGLRTNIVRNLGLTSSTVNVGFDNIGQLTSWSATESGGTPRLNEQLGFGFDAADNLHTRNNGNLAQTFNVDAANELTNVSRAGTFTLSGATPAPSSSVTVNGQSAQTYGDFTFAQTNLALVNGQNNFTNVAQNVYGLKVTNILTVNLPQSVNFSSDNNGSLTNDGLKTLAYDAENQLTSVTVAGQWRNEFVYDGFNRRRIFRDYRWDTGTSGWVKTNEVRYICDGYLPVQERDSNNVPQVTYTRGLDLSGSLSKAGGIGGLLARTDTNGSVYYHGDALGNITALMDAQENIVGRYLYGPFGKPIGEWGPMAPVNVMQFSSMPYYTKAGIVGYPLRPDLTDPDRWATVDPIGEPGFELIRHRKANVLAGGANRYQFVRNNPIRYLDRFGLQTSLQIPNGGLYTMVDPSIDLDNFYESQWAKTPQPGSGWSGAANAVANAADAYDIYNSENNQLEPPGSNKKTKPKCPDVMSPYTSVNAPPYAVNGPPTSWPVDQVTNNTFNPSNNNFPLPYATPPPAPPVSNIGANSPPVLNPPSTPHPNYSADQFMRDLYQSSVLGSD